MYIVYGKKDCPYCTKAVQLLQSRGLDFTYSSMDNRLNELVQWALQHDHKTVPLIIQVVSGTPVLVGGYDNLCAWLQPKTLH